MALVTLHPTDIRQFLYCPRIIYFTYVQPVRKLPTLKMRAGAAVHAVEEREDNRGRRQRRDLPTGKRQHNVYLQSKQLGITGKLDMLIHTDDNRLVPIELKPSPKLETRHQYQLVTYAMMVAEMMNAQVPEGYIYSLATRKSLLVPITQEKIRHVHNCISQIRKMIDAEHYPEPTTGRRGGKCRDCEYRLYCAGT